MKKDNPQSYCLKYGIKAYPIYQNKDEYKKGVIAHEKGNWYIEVDNNGKLTKFKKSVGVGLKCSGVNFEIPLKKTYQYYMDQIRNQKQ